MNNIEDITSLKELRTQKNETKKMLNNKKLLKTLGITPMQKMKMLADIRKFEKDFNSLFTLPDDFNNTFEGTGWIAYESMSVDVMKESLEIANINGVEIAEEFLVKYYSDKDKIIHLCMKAKRNFGERSILFQDAVDDHFEKKYYSCIPILFMIIDGFVNEIEATGFFAESTDLIAWDSIVGHKSGLNKISKLMSKTRRKTNIEEIKIPYRNGILHGRDLNYANPIVSSKLLAVTFALMDWSIAKRKMKAGETKESYETPSIEETIESLSHLAEQGIRNQNQIFLQEKWKKRELIIGIDIPKTGQLTEYKEGTPERCLIEIFHNINDKNYGNLADKIYYNSKNISKGKKAGELKTTFKDFSNISFELFEIEDVSSAITVIKTKIEMEINEKRFSKDENFRLIYSDSEQNPYVRNSDEGSWRVIDNFSTQWEIFHIKNI